MIINRNDSLKKYTTFRVGGVAENLYIPENEKELIDISLENYHRNKKVYIIGAGSNCLINDMHAFTDVISINKACTEIKDLVTGTFILVLHAVSSR